MEELGVVVAAAEVLEVERLLRGDHHERLAEARRRGCVGAEDVDVREGQLGRLDPGAQEAAVAVARVQLLGADPVLLGLGR